VPGILAGLSLLLFAACQSEMQDGRDDSSIVLWSTPGARWMITPNQPLVYDSLVVFQLPDSNLWALDRETGELAWRLDYGGGMHPITYSPVQQGSYGWWAGNYGVHKVDVGSGELVWHHSTGAEETSGRHLSLDGQLLHYGGWGHYFQVDLDSGAELSRVHIGENVRAAVPRQDRVYLCSYSLTPSGFPHYGHLRCLSKADGGLIWIQEFPGDCLKSRPAFYGSLVIVSTDRGAYAIDAGTGTELWFRESPEGARISPQVSGNELYLGTRYGFARISLPDLGTVWETDRLGLPGYGTHNDFALSESTIFCVLENSVMGYSRETGEIVFAYTPPDMALAQPTYRDGVLYFSGGRNMYAIDVGDVD